MSRCFSPTPRKALGAFDSAQIRRGLEGVADLISRARYFEAMKTLRALYPLEDAEMFPVDKAAASHAA